jgi:hypothetical protein
MYRSIEALRDRLQEESDILCLKAEHIEECAEHRGIGLTVPENMYIKALKDREDRYDEAITHLTRALTVLDRIDV